MTGKSVIHCLKCLVNLNHPETQTTANEQHAMIKYAQLAKVIAEIGVYEGFNTRQFAIQSSANTIIYAIDPFFKGFFGVSYGKLIATNNWKKNKIRNKIKIVEGLSWDVAHLINEPIDFLFIDGDHTFTAVKKDFELYSKKISNDGIIAFHDARIFSNGWTNEDWGSVRLINEIIRPDKKWNVVEEVDSIVFIQRNYQGE